VTGRDQRAGRRWLTAWRVVRRLPEPVVMSLGALGGLLYYRLDERRREALRTNLRQVLGPEASDAQVERVVRKGFRLYGRYWGEAFRLENLTREDIRARMRIEGREHLDAALAKGQGTILAVPHLGNWDAGAAWVVAEGYPLTTIVERLKPAELFDRFVAYRRALGMEILPLDNGSEGMRGLLRALRAGRVVALVCDRDLTGHGLPVRIFGAAAMMPGGPASLALKTGAALLPCGVFHDRKAGRWVSVVRPAIRVEPSGDQRADVLALTQRLADAFEGLILRAPEQWHMLSRYWREAPSGEAALAAGEAALTLGEPAPPPSGEEAPTPPRPEDSTAAPAGGDGAAAAPGRPEDSASTREAAP
jgi:phosphatidylinositol dimannoside acyltransferase